ncbi:serine carboxypeptidase-like 44 [Hibiscus trionum]|uniref:Serine carboxypeptidase-like 44 n=1 Tax=Hibiscus trionum TaxID=183268 RepID=A0A9W7LIK0_HIBTR|nr:serine carboxypeptidase-like 44 [Hibiscus trionum]
MEIHGIFLLCYLFLAHGVGVDGFPMYDLITKLPGQPDVNFRQFAGYIDVDDGVSGLSFFYYFVEAENDPMNRPLTVWLTGGQGCSSVGDAFSSVGPFITTKNARGLDRNLFSWNKVSNLLFIDSPIGAGWSYSNTSSDYNHGDDSTKKRLVTFMQKWYETYPSFKSRDLYLAGSSYAGHYVPNLANALLDANKQSKELKFNLKGIALGNPVLRRKLDILARNDFFFNLGLIDSMSHDEVKKECNTIDENNYFSKFETNWTHSCQLLLEYTPFMIDHSVYDSVYYANAKLFDAIRDPCVLNFTDLRLGNELTKVSEGVDMCTFIRPGFYFNLPEVQKAFHGNRTNLPYQWEGCRSKKDKLNYNENDKNRDMLPVLKSLLQQSIPITIFSGDVDGTMPATGTLQHLYKLAEEMEIKTAKAEAWSHENREGGQKYSFGDLLTFFTVIEADHHVTFSKPSEALYIFTNFTINRKH